MVEAGSSGSLSQPTAEERYRVSSPRECLAILNQLCSRRALVRLASSSGAEPIISVLLSVDPEDAVIVFDASQDPQTNASLANAQRLNVQTDLDGVRIQFDVGSVRARPRGDGTVLEAPFPASILRLQRREFFRIAPPANRPIIVQVHAQLGSAVWVTAARGVDISCGGLVLLIEGDVEGLEEGQVLKRTRVTLPEVATIEANLEVRNVVASKRQDGKSLTRVGCSFVGLDQANSARVQRYINRLEVELRRRT